MTEATRHPVREGWNTHWRKAQRTAGLLVPVVSLSLFAAACGVAPDADPVTATAEPFSAAECGYWIDGDPPVTPQYDAVFYGPNVVGPNAVGLPVVTPTTYSNAHCWRGFLVASMLDQRDTTLNTGGGPTAKVTISWNDVLPTNKTDCNSSFIQAIAYTFKVRDPGRGVHATGAPSSSGVWFGWPLNRCVVPPVVLDSATYLQPLEPASDTTYRFAITGRAPDATTRSLRLTYDPAIVVH